MYLTANIENEVRILHQISVDFCTLLLQTQNMFTFIDQVLCTPETSAGKKLRFATLTPETQ